MKALVRITAALAVVLSGGLATAAEISSIQLDNVVLDADGVPVTTVVAGAAYTYTVNYSITGSDLSGVAVTINADLPEGLWVYESNAPASFLTNCQQTGGNQWKFNCTFTAADLDINTAGGIAGQARIQVRSRRFFLAHGDVLDATADIAASYTNTAGEPASATATAAHAMTFTASPAVHITTYINNGTQGYRYYKMMTGPNGEPGVAFDVAIRATNTGSAPLTDVVLTDTLPAGFRVVANGGNWTRDEPTWSTGTLTFRRSTLGVWNSVNESGGILSPSSQNIDMALTVWAPCDVLALTRSEDGAVPGDMFNSISIAARGYGLDADGNATQQVVGDDTPDNNAVAVPNLSGWSCGTGQAYLHKWNASNGVEPGGGVQWVLKASPPISATYSEDAVVWDALDPTMASFYGASIASPNDGTFTLWYCDLSDEVFAPSEARGNFLGAWKDDPTRCSDVAPADATAWGAITHLFFHAPAWGTQTPEPGDYARELDARVYTRTHPTAIHDDVFSNTAWYESDQVSLRGRTDNGTISDQSFPTIITPFPVTGQNPPFVAPGEQVTINARLSRAGNPLALDPVLTTTLPPGVIYKGSAVVFGANCQAAEADGSYPPGSLVPVDYSAIPTTTLLGDGSLQLVWTFGSAAHPFRLRGRCPNTTSGYDQVNVQVTLEVDPNGSYTNGQQLTTAFHVDASNEVPGTSPYYDQDYTLLVTVPGEMRVEVVPWCEELGRIGFNAAYENSGGVDLTNVAVVFPMPETVDPAGAPYDVTQFAGATFADPTSVLEYQVGGAWSATAPANLASVTAVRLLVPSLPANSGPQALFVDIAIPAGNPGDSRIHAAAAMQADQLTDAASPVSIPFVVDTCPRGLVVTKFFDADGDGARDASEPVLKGWRFEVRDGGGGLIDSRTTNALGQASFTLIQGQYSVTETLPEPADGEPTWSATTPGGVTQTVAIGLDQPSYALDFGNRCACDDGDPCTDDTCDAVQGCLYAARTCDDGNACTSDSCDSAAGGCQNTPIAAGTSCDDGSACTGGETCDASGHCTPATVVDCQAAGPCVTSASCDAATGACDLVYAAAGTACTGDSACQAFACDGSGGCVAGAPVVCDDGNVCTADSCDPVAGCVNAPVAAGASCDDADLCTTGDRCDGGGACVGAAVECNDNGLCQEPGTCDATSGQCVYTSTPCYLANFWTAVADAEGRLLGSVKCGFDAAGEPFCDTNADGSLKIYPDLQCVAGAGTATLPADGASGEAGAAAGSPQAPPTETATPADHGTPAEEP